jgi:hypothetical protein
MSKGSDQRPRYISKKQFDSNWDKIFKSKQSKDKKKDEDK